MKASFNSLVKAVVSGIKHGEVMTYGQIAALCGSARAARIVGGIAHYGDPNLPWHRVVNKKGGLASGFPGGRAAHFSLLVQEGYEFDSINGENLVDLSKHLKRLNCE